ncbi:MAG: NapC/NirT family cytochrome c [Planctomycetota bacterium]|jgi:nitrate/TMAO reductase-like tetraheme cytochrome c subunit
MRYIKAIFASGMNVLRQLNWPARILLVMVAIAVVSTGSIVITGQPGFCNSCHIMNPYYGSWEKSSHSEVNCLDCHLQPGFAGYVKGKINGLAQAVDCIVGRVGTKPNATVQDISCLRSECHSVEDLVSKDIDYHGIKFTHKNHVAKEIDGITISCGTCHSHFAGDEHFTVNNDVCFTCHFLKSDESSSRLAQTSCRDCHEVPREVIERGLVTIDHAEYITYSASCEDSCHKKEIEKISDVADSVCLNCHSFGKEQQADSVQLHETHTNHEKVECFACHGKVSHGQTKVASVSAMMECRNCHSDTHEVQRSIYATQHPMQDENSKLVLSPMFLTHVECNGCHIERVGNKSGTLDSLGTVAKAVPGACDNCHEEGTGQRYVPFWQKKIKALYEQINHKLDRLEERARFESNEQLAQKLSDRAGQARSILDSVSSDGSWGVHNLKYTEAMLLKANKIITEVQ